MCENYQAGRYIPTEKQPQAPIKKMCRNISFWELISKCKASRYHLVVYLQTKPYLGKHENRKLGRGAENGGLFFFFLPSSSMVPSELFLTLEWQEGELRADYSSPLLFLFQLTRFRKKNKNNFDLFFPAILQFSLWF